MGGNDNFPAIVRVVGLSKPSKLNLIDRRSSEMGLEAGGAMSCVSLLYLVYGLVLVDIVDEAEEKR